jgi:hypothetical protein
MPKPSKTQARTPASMGLSNDDISHIASMMHVPPTDFDNEVQRHLNILAATPADEFGAQAENRAEAIQNTSEGGNPPVIPGPATKPLSESAKPDFSSL